MQVIPSLSLGLEECRLMCSSFFSHFIEENRSQSTAAHSTVTGKVLMEG